jgi:hypothetical protein
VCENKGYSLTIECQDHRLYFRRFLLQLQLKVGLLPPATGMSLIPAASLRNLTSKLIIIIITIFSPLFFVAETFDDEVCILMSKTHPREQK